MKTIILDTNVLIDHVHGFALWLDSLLKVNTGYTFIVPTIVISEYLTAQEIDTKEGKEKSEKYLAFYKTQDLNTEIAYILGQILRRKSYPPGADLGDLIIASTALYLNAELATNNKSHFNKIPNLKFFDPTDYLN